MINPDYNIEWRISFWNIKAIRLVLIFLSCCQINYAQTVERIIPLEDHLLKVKLWTEKDGIPHWHLSGSFQDSRGFLWGDWKGVLTQFDGKAFKEIRRTPEKLHEFNSTFFAEDQQRNIWMISQSNYITETSNSAPISSGIQIYDPVQERFFTLAQYLSTDAHESLPTGWFHLYSLNQIVYLAFHEAGEVWRYDGELQQVAKGLQFSPKRSSTNETPIILPATENLWWSTNFQDGVKVLDADGNIVFHDADFKGATQYFLDEDLSLICYQPGEKPSRLYLRNGKFEKNLLEPPRNSRRFLGHAFKQMNLTDPGGSHEGNQMKLNLWMAQFWLDEGLNVMGEIASQFPELQMDVHSQVPKYNPLVMKDGKVLVNLGVDGMLQFQLIPRSFQHTLVGRNIRHLSFADNILYANDGGGNLLSVKLTKDKSPASAPNIFIPKNSYTPSFALADGLLIIDKSDLKMMSFDGKVRSSLATIEPNVPVYVYTGIQVIDSIAWISSEKQGVFAFDLKSRTLNHYLKNQTVHFVHKDRSGQLWAGTGNGLYNMTHQRFYLDSIAGKPLVVSHLYEQDANTFWLATHQGLVRWETPTDVYQQFTIKDGLSDNFLYAVYKDQFDRLWLSSNNGITAFDMETFAATVFHEEDGLCTNEHNQWTHLQDADGWLYFGGLRGVNIFNPNNIPKTNDELTHELIINQIQLYGSSGQLLKTQSATFDKKQPILLPRSCEQLGLNLALPHYDWGPESEIEWRIPQRNSTWRKIDANESIFLFNLPLGSFSMEFRVRFTQRTKAVKATYHLDFYNNYPLYYSLYFWLGIVLLASISVVSLYRWRSRSIRNRNRILKAEVKRRTQEIEVKNEKLAKIDAAKNQLFNNISHELRTPLNIIQLSAEQSVNAEGLIREKKYEDIKLQVKRMTNMIKEVMDLKKLDLGETEAKLEPVQWNSFLQQNFHMLESLAHQKRIDYEIRIRPQESTYLSIDNKMIETILYNLIGNAIKFTPKDGRILVRSEIRDELVEVVVTDNGPGIKQEEQEDIFTRYYQGENANGLAQPGYGIGLALCREYAQLMGGNIVVESAPERGASFFFTFPKVLAKPIANLNEQIPTVNAEREVRTFSNIKDIERKKERILVVEDNSILLDLITEILRTDYEIITATNGQEAFEQLEKPTHDIKIVVTDIMMPIMDGYSLLASVRNHPRMGFIPFLFLSALSSDQDQLKAFRLGVDSYLTKPFEAVDLKIRVKNLIKNQLLRQGFIENEKQVHQDNERPPGIQWNDADLDTKERLSYDDAWVQELDSIIKTNIARTDFKVTDIAFQLHISERTLRTRLKEYTGLSPNVYIQRARLDLAMLYIEDGKYRTISELSYAVGFKSDRYFSRLFKKAFGKFPSEYL